VSAQKTGTAGTPRPVICRAIVIASNAFAIVKNGPVKTPTWWPVETATARPEQSSSARRAASGPRPRSAERREARLRARGEELPPARQRRVQRGRIGVELGRPLRKSWNSGARPGYFEYGMVGSAAVTGSRWRNEFSS
jgi:hypothetical protein